MTLILNSFKDIKKTLKDLYYPVDSKMLNERIEILSKRSIKKRLQNKRIKNFNKLYGFNYIRRERCT